jgi:hypothetical protein
MFRCFGVEFNNLELVFGSEPRRRFKRRQVACHGPCIDVYRCTDDGAPRQASKAPLATRCILHRLQLTLDVEVNAGFEFKTKCRKKSFLY